MALDRQVLLAAEGAAVGHQFDVDVVDIDSENGGDLALVVVHSLALRPDLQTAVLRGGETGLGLEKSVLDALGRERFLDGVGGSRKGGIDIAAGERAGLEQIAAVVDGWGVVCQRRLGRAHRVEHLVIDLHHIRRRPRPVLAVGHHHGEHVANAACRFTFGHQQRPVLDDQAMVPGAGDVLRGEHTLDSRHGQRRSGMDAEDPCSRVFRQNQSPVQHAIDAEVGHEVLGAESLLATPVAGARGPDSVALGNIGRSLESVGLAEEQVGSRWAALQIAALAPGLSRGLDRIDDAVVTGTAADVAGQRPLDPGAVGRQVLVEEVGGANGDSGRAEAALNGALVDEGGGEQLALPFRQAFEGHHLTPGDLLGVGLARQRRFAVEEDGAAPADAFRCTAVLCGRDTADLP